MASRIGAFDVSILVKGIPGLLGVLDQLPIVLRKRLMKQSMGRGATILLAKAVLLAPVGPTGNLVRSLRKKVGISRRNKNGAYAVMGAEYSNKGHHASLVEHGTKGPRVPETQEYMSFAGTGAFKGGYFRKKIVAPMPASNFMERTYHSAGPAALNKVSTSLLDGVERTAIRLARGGT